MKHKVQFTIRMMLTAMALCVGLTTLIHGQEITGSIVGTVKDANGSGVSGATVTVTDRAKQVVVRTVTTNDAGEFSVPLLPVSLYDITVEAANFKKHLDEGVKLNVNERRTIDVTLETGNISETVTVTSDLLQVNTQSATASTVIS